MRAARRQGSAHRAVRRSESDLDGRGARRPRPRAAQHEVALVGFDDIPLADVVEPGVTVVAQDPLALGRSAAELLFARLERLRRPVRAAIVVPTRLDRARLGRDRARGMTVQQCAGHGEARSASA